MRKRLSSGQKPVSIHAFLAGCDYGDEWVDSGEKVTALYGAGVIGVTNTAPFPAGTAIRINGTEASVTQVHQAGAPGILVIAPHIPVTGGEMIEVKA